MLADSAREPLAYNLLLMRVFLRMGPLRYFLTVREMQRDDAFHHACAIRAPTLVLQGSRDRIVPTQIARELAQVLARTPGSALRRFLHSASTPSF